MKAKVIVQFYDIPEKVTRKPGEEIEVTEARFKEINSTEFGDLIEKVATAKKTTTRRTTKKETA